MGYSTTVPILAGLAILGSLTGVTIGRSTVSQINPIYFQPPSSHFYADMVPYRSSGEAQPDLGGTDYLEAEYAYSAEPACGACNDYPIDTAPLRLEAVDGIDDGRSASAPIEPSLASAETEGAEPAPASRVWIERYTNYEVAPDPVEAPEPEVPIQGAV
jgi:hypothetical protein